MDPVGYKRINKKTGQEIGQENIVKGIEYGDGNYVVLSAEEIKAAYPKSTQTIEIESFVPANSVPFLFFERPYYIAPINRGAKVYALLREILIKTGKVGLAKVVIQTKQHLAILMPIGPALVLNLLRWGDEIRGWEELDLPPEGTKEAGLTEKEIKLGQQLVEDMSGDWNPEQFTDSFKEQILHLVEKKVKAGETSTVEQVEPAEFNESAHVYDLTAMLQRSLQSGRASKKVSSDEEPAEQKEKRASPKFSSKSSSPKSVSSRSSSVQTMGKANKLAAKTVANKSGTRISKSRKSG
jgi:DNA end-binding protein Ku